MKRWIGAMTWVILMVMIPLVFAMYPKLGNVYGQDLVAINHPYPMVTNGVMGMMKTHRCILTLELKQTHFSLNPMTHAKDAMNTVTFEIPVDRAFYQEVNIGDVLTDKFRTGSLILKGSYGKWKVSVKAKREE